MCCGAEDGGEGRKSGPASDYLMKTGTLTKTTPTSPLHIVAIVALTHNIILPESIPIQINKSGILFVFLHISRSSAPAGNAGEVCANPSFTIRANFSPQMFDKHVLLTLSDNIFSEP